MNVYVGIIIEAMLGMIFGTNIGVILMSLLQINKKDAVTVIQKFYGEMEQERKSAIKEEKSIDYINGMSRILALYRTFLRRNCNE